VRILDPLTARVDVHYEGFRFDDDLNTRRLDAGTTVDARLDWRIHGPLSAFVSAENLFDQDIVTAVTGDGARSFGPPQLFRVGLTYRR
jgi:outer membrane receptor protein involved in Fe transport